MTDRQPDADTATAVNELVSSGKSMADAELIIATCKNEQMEAGRWFIALDMNCDGLVTISDVGSWLEWLFFLPGDGFVWVLMQSQPIATFLEITSEPYGGWGLGLLSGAVWLVVAGLAMSFEERA